MENGSILMVPFTHHKSTSIDLDIDKVDNKILLTALQLKKQGKKVFFVSKDINARVKATAVGIKAVDYEKQKVQIDELYSGHREYDSSDENINMIKTGTPVEWKNNGLHENEFVLLKNKKSEESVMGIFKDELIHPLNVQADTNVSGIEPLNQEQQMALHMLLDPDITLVTLVGKAGTGKTLLAIASGLRLVLDEHLYTRVLVSRPVIPMGKDIGYLPGAKSEKLAHWMQPLFDNLDFILSVHKRQNVKSVDSLLNNNLIEIEALTYIRGRSLPKQFIIVDEAQNLSPHEIKTIVSRAGEGTKVVLTGDPYQIDSPYLDANSNGLTYLVETFKGQKVSAHVTLDKSERSPLAELAAELL